MLCMPVPEAETKHGPRRLLRDVVYDKLCDAIEQGVLERGERLNDDELVVWLGVSRTPIREAMARLQAEGLVEMEANRFTRVARLSLEGYQDAARFLHGLHMLALQDDAVVVDERERIRTEAAAVDVLSESKSMEGFRRVLDLYGDLVVAGGNPLFTDTERSIRGRVKHHAVSAAVSIDWIRYEQARNALTQ
jgi:DNA-binding GntR family transcriptional regulator